MTYTKSFSGKFARHRFEMEVAAYKESNLFWTSWAAGWTNPQLIAASPDGCTIEVTLIEGAQCTWDDCNALARKLAGAMSLYSNIGTVPWREYILDNICNEITKSVPMSVASVVTDWLARRKPAVFRIHGDFKPNNIIRNTEGLALLDWELSRYGVLPEDAGSLIANGLIAEGRGQTNCVSSMIKALCSDLPEEVCAALAVVDLSRQARRENLIGDTSNAEFRMNLALEWAKLWFTI